MTKYILRLKANEANLILGRKINGCIQNTIFQILFSTLVFERNSSAECKLCRLFKLVNQKTRKCVKKATKNTQNLRQFSRFNVHRFECA